MNIDLIYDEIEREYDYQRQDNLRTEQRRRSEVYEKIPALKELTENNRSVMLKELQARLEERPIEDKSGEQPLFGKALSERKRELLVANGYPADYLEPVFLCKDCEDTGHLRDEYGARRLPCQCFKKKVTRRLGEISGLFDRIRTENFDHLSDAYYEGEDLANFKRAEKLCREFVSNTDGGCQNFLFYGNIGTGKTFLSCCMAAELIRQGREVLYFSSVSFFDRLAQYRFSDRSAARDERSDVLDDLYECDMLILDDLGTERVNQLIMSELFALIDERLRRKKSTVISTNLTLKDISDTYSERVFSRISSGYTLCKLTGKDVRLEKIRTKNKEQS